MEDSKNSYVKARSAITPPFPQLDALGYDDCRLIKTKFIDLDASQRFVYFNLLDHLHRYVDEFLGGPDNFDAPGVEGVFNWCSWHHALMGLVQRLDNPMVVDSSQDCFFVALYPSQSADDGRLKVGDTYPKLRFRLGGVERQPETGLYKFHVKDIPQGNASPLYDVPLAWPSAFRGSSRLPQVQELYATLH